MSLVIGIEKAMAIFPAMVSACRIFEVKRHWKLKWSGCLEREKMSSVLFKSTTVRLR